MNASTNPSGVSREGFFASEVAPHFAIEGALLSVVPFGSGHINHTYLATYRDGSGEKRFIFQQINDAVFTDVPTMMRNIARVTGHVRSKLAHLEPDDADRRVLSLVPPLARTGDGHDALIAGDGTWWRAYRCIEGASSRDTGHDAAGVRSVAAAFGRFISLLDDLPGERLAETIPHFHDTPKRFNAFVDAVERDPLGRAVGACEEIAFCERNAPLADALETLRGDGVRERVVHNDTKINNVMLDDITGEALCVIDLDTVMPGLALYDLGDLIRTATMRAAEDERDLSRCNVDTELFAAVTAGFIEGAGDALSPVERRHAVTAGRVITYECGLRLLTDHLLGDAYFPARRTNHNLDRARTQFALLTSLTRNAEGLLNVSS